MPLLCPDLHECSWLQARKGFLQPWHEGQKSLELIGMRDQHHDSDWKSRDVLLEREVPINCDERIELCRGEHQESTVLDPAPTHLHRGFYRVAGQCPAETAGY